MAEERLRHKAILGLIDKGRAGLGFFPFTHTNSTEGKERRQLIQEVRAGVEVRYSKMVSLSQQGAWTRWDNVEKKKGLHGIYKYIYIYIYLYLIKKNYFNLFISSI